MKKQLIILILLLFGMQSFAQTKQQFKKQLKKTHEDLQKEKPANVFAFDAFCKAIPDVVLEETEAFKSDTLSGIRSFRIQLINRAGTFSTDTSIRKKAVYELAEACKDEDETIRDFAAGSLKRFTKQDFTSQAKQHLKELLEYDHGYYKHVVQLIGWLDMQGERKQLEGLLEDTTHNNPEIKWKVHTALARLGREASIDYCVNYAKSKDMNDLLVRFVLKDLAYIKQKEAVGYLVSELYIDEQNCRAANPMSSARITCAYRIMELLAPVVKNYPYKIKYGTQLEAPSYDKALEDIRKWFKENPDYEILREGF